MGQSQSLDIHIVYHNLVVLAFLINVNSDLNIPFFTYPYYLVLAVVFRQLTGVRKAITRLKMVGWLKREKCAKKYVLQ